MRAQARPRPAPAIEHLLGEHEEARARLADALEQLPDPATPEAVALMIELAVDSLFEADYRRCATGPRGPSTARGRSATAR